MKTPWRLELRLFPRSGRQSMLGSKVWEVVEAGATSHFPRSDWGVSPPKLREGLPPCPKWKTILSWRKGRMSTGIGTLLPKLPCPPNPPSTYLRSKTRTFLLPLHDRLFSSFVSQSLPAIPTSPVFCGYLTRTIQVSSGLRVTGSITPSCFQNWQSNCQCPVDIRQI